MRPRRVALLAIASVGFAYCVVIQPIGWNQASHYALIRSIDDHTPRIDRYAGSTGDRARYHGHWYSARAPGLALMSVPLYEGFEVTGSSSQIMALHIGDAVRTRRICEAALAEDWNRPEEDEAWSHLQPVRS